MVKGKIKQGRGRSLKGSKETFENKLYKMSEGTIELVGDYKGSRFKALVRCNICGREWKSFPKKLLSGYGCAVCGSFHSKGERAINKYLRSCTSLDFEREKSFDGLVGVNGGPLRFDFYIKEKNAVIEFQGVQHYMPIKHFGGKHGFAERREHDKRKREYCKNNGIKEIEISYNDFNRIGEILEEQLNL